jgi:multidrug resistance efflux pump
VGTALVALGAGGLIPLPHHVGGDATAKTHPDNRHLVTTPTAGQARVHVQPQERVEPGDVLLTLEDVQLSDRIREQERQIEAKEGELRASQAELERVEKRLQSAENEMNQALLRLDSHQRDWQVLISGQGLPRDRQLVEERAAIEQERDGIQDEMRNLEAQIAELESQRNRITDQIPEFQERVQMLEESYIKLEDAHEDGAISDLHLGEQSWQLLNRQQELEQLYTERTQIGYQIEQLRHQIARQSSLSQGRTHNSQAHEARRQELIREVQEEGQDLQERYDRLRDERNTVQAEVNRALTQVRNHQEAIAALQNELQILNERKQSFTITAEHFGTVLTSDLDKKNGRYFPAGTEILETANLQLLQGTAQISQGDRHLVKKEQPLEFRVANQPNLTYLGEVEDISPMMIEEDDGIKTVFEVKFSLENPDNLPLLEAEGYVQIRTKNLNLYQAIQHQFGQLIDLRRYFPWVPTEDS